MSSPYQTIFYPNAAPLPYVPQPPAYYHTTESNGYVPSTYTNLDSSLLLYPTEGSDPWPLYTFGDPVPSPNSWTYSPSPSPSNMLPDIMMFPNPPIDMADVSPVASSSSSLPPAEDQSLSDSLEILQQILQEHSGRLTCTNVLRGTHRTKASHDRRRKNHISHRCVICDQGFTTKHRVKEHVYAHFGLKLYRAPCGFQSSYRHDAKRHSTRCAICRDHQTL